jgi:hypothetical protein
VIVTAITDQESEHASVIHLRAIEGLLERLNCYLRWFGVKPQVISRIPL